MTRRILRATFSFSFFTLSLWAVLGNAPANAHALLISTEPANNSILQTPPSQLVLHFGEKIEAAAGSLQLYDADGQRIFTGSPHHLSGDANSVAVDVEDLDRGAYVATWRWLSADSHPVRGAFTFQVGTIERIDTSGLVGRLLTRGKGSQTVGALFGVFRFGLLFAIIILLGSFIFSIFIESTTITLRISLWSSVAVVVLSLLTVPLQGAYIAAISLGEVRWQTISDVFESRYGVAALARVFAATLSAMALVTIAKRSLRSVIIGSGAGIVALSLAFGGHGFAGRWPYLGAVVDVTHVITASIWIGGLACLVLSWRQLIEKTKIMGRFSSIAFYAVIAVVASGLVQGWRQLAEFDALTSTDYGRLLLIKSGMVVVMVLLGGIARRALFDLGRVRLLIVTELALSAVVIVVTSLLINAPPAISVASEPVTTEIVTSQHLVDVIVDPARTGTNTIHVYLLDKQGVPADVPELTSQLVLPAKDVGPIEIPLQHVAVGHWAGYAFLIPLSGEWQIKMRIRTDKITSETTQIAFRVR